MKHLLRHETNKNMSRGLFYITTPIFYVNDKPHLGTAYTAIIADILRRYHRLFGGDTFLLTGTDEHGQKALEAAKARRLDPKEHCREMRGYYQKAWKKLHIDIDFGPKGHRFKRSLFFHTAHRYSDEGEPDRADHTKAVQNALQILSDKGDIYSSSYKGWYCVSEETFYTEKDLVGGKSPTGKEVIPLEEKNYFFKMSKYQDRLKQHLESHSQFIRPPQRQNEVKGFLRKPLQDLCISRPKKRVPWGIELPFDPNYVTYVWVDALLNYINGAGYGSARAEDIQDFEKWWKRAGAVHLIGKDILITHGVYWPCLLMALDLPLPKTILAHGWLLNESQEKMSKSKGEKLDPLALSDDLGVSELRYFLAREIPLGNDARISKEMMIRQVNQDLADQLGNLLSRTSRLAETGFEGKVPLLEKNAESPLKALTEKTIEETEKKINEFQLSQALESIQDLLGELNRFLEREAPWKLIKTNKSAAGQSLSIALEALRISGVLLFPVMPEKMGQMLKILGDDLPEDGLGPKRESLKWGQLNLLQKNRGKKDKNNPETNGTKKNRSEKDSQKILKSLLPLFPKRL